MIKKGGTYVVMGLLNTDSIAYATGKMIESLGGKVIYTVQNERLKKIFFDRGCTDISQEEKDAMKGPVNIDASFVLSACFYTS